ncbi:phosphoribosylformimino-5-aminoimidazole carboxamide ribotide isomerase [Methylobacterium sp. BE186]|uniref:HisA/HisF-related TIM barrel protein n=1 Tax=Methylobacterium sp. BE186 TaxID=2817715 RepID=UPI0028602723|nr:HisA/HisF-related TIM barrel protein [Methylobacterium sp. BE186]MDR7037268.1 phosphoribosylformimino-5-aminoimidazole carboxamide ribotide isomerase [Methylobacterium sp. BE186]
MGTSFAVIPVIDLRHGRVVRARRGERHSYAPIETPLAKGSDPGAVAAALVDAVEARILYLADLDAIMEGTPPDLASVADVARACPGTTLWLDAGFAEAAGVEALVGGGLARPVLGSESQRDAGLVRTCGSRAVLSLDSRGADRLDPAGIHARPEIWPDDVIVMTLARIGADLGPDLDGLAQVRASAPRARLYAAGGVRGPADLAALREAGAAGALVASAIHDGRITAADLADG